MNILQKRWMLRKGGSHEKMCKLLILLRALNIHSPTYIEHELTRKEAKGIGYYPTGGVFLIYLESLFDDWEYTTLDELEVGIMEMVKENNKNEAA